MSIPQAAPRIHTENGGLQRRITESIHEYADSPDFGERRACVNSGFQAVFLTAWVRGYTSYSYNARRGQLPRTRIGIVRRTQAVCAEGLHFITYALV